MNRSLVFMRKILWFDHNRALELSSDYQTIRIIISGGWLVPVFGVFWPFFGSVQCRIIGCTTLHGLLILTDSKTAQKRIKYHFSGNSCRAPMRLLNGCSNDCYFNWDEMSARYCEFQVLAKYIEKDQWNLFLEIIKTQNKSLLLEFSTIKEVKLLNQVAFFWVFSSIIKMHVSLPLQFARWILSLSEKLQSSFYARKKLFMQEKTRPHVMWVYPSAWSFTWPIRSNLRRISF